jgi:hypothetical protein
MDDRKTSIAGWGSLVCSQVWACGGAVAHQPGEFGIAIMWIVAAIYFFRRASHVEA